jgi:hypothetical protein
MKDKKYHCRNSFNIHLKNRRKRKGAVGKWKFPRVSKIVCALTRGQVGFEKNYEAL